VAAVEPGRLGERIGLACGDSLLAINRRRLRDEIDVLFWSADGIETISWRTRSGRVVRRRLDSPGEEPLGLTFEPMRPDVCGNDCVFCFVYQNPRGLRRQVYIKDEDYRLSFLHGNYITGTSLRRSDLRRIVQMRLSPLHFSVHATDPALRRRLLGREDIPDILHLLRHLRRHDIEFHTQVVVCPGWNDGEAAVQTIEDLLPLRPQLLSIAFVPVGLTSHREGLTEIARIGESEARRFLRFAESLKHRTDEEVGEPILYLADEWYLHANWPVPDYSDLPFPHQLENGVGMIWFFLRHWGRARRRFLRPLPRPWRVAALTGPLAAKGLGDFWAELNSVENLTVDPVVVENTLFGEATTVTGLLPGGDFRRAMRGCAGRFDQVLIPGNALREWDHIFIDDLPLGELIAEGDSFGLRVDAVLGDATDTWETIQARCCDTVEEPAEV
jgi:putative radical SAM enzyme (TIGR03279 family)